MSLNTEIKQNTYTQTANKNFRKVCPFYIALVKKTITTKRKLGYVDPPL